jgi:hypothetical protein
MNRCSPVRPGCASRTIDCQRRRTEALEGRKIRDGILMEATSRPRFSCMASLPAEPPWDWPLATGRGTHRHAFTPNHRIPARWPLHVSQSRAHAGARHRRPSNLQPTPSRGSTKPPRPVQRSKIRDVNFGTLAGCSLTTLPEEAANNIAQGWFPHCPRGRRLRKPPDLTLLFFRPSSFLAVHLEWEHAHFAGDSDPAF